MKIVSSRLRVAIARAGYTQSKFANECDISRDVINKLCNDKYKYEPQDYTLQRFSQILGVTPEYLTGKEGFDPLENLSKEERVRRALFDLMVEAGSIEPITDGRGLFRLAGSSGSVDMTESEMQELIKHFQRRLTSMCDDYIELCTVRDRGNISI